MFNKVLEGYYFTFTLSLSLPLSLSLGILNDVAKYICANGAFLSLHCSIIRSFSSRSSDERKDLSARAVSRRRTLSYFYWFARWGVVKGRQPPVLPPPSVAVSAPLPPLYAKEVKRDGGEWEKEKNSPYTRLLLLFLSVSPLPRAVDSPPLAFPTDAAKEKYSLKKKERSDLTRRVTLQPFIRRTSEKKISRSVETARASSTRKVKSFLSSLLRQIAAAGERGNGKRRPAACLRREEDGGGLNAEKVSAEISFATGVQSARAGNPHLCSNGMGFVRCSAMAAFFS